MRKVINIKLARKLGLFESLVIQDIATSLQDEYTGDKEFLIYHEGLRYCNLEPKQIINSLDFAGVDEVKKAFKGLVNDNVVILKKINGKKYMGVDPKN